MINRGLFIGAYETAKANGLEPYAYIRHVLEHIATADTVEKLERLLPWNVKIGN